MLVVTRRPGEKLLIGNDIEIMIVANRPGRVRIGVKAPQNTKILRPEILEKTKRCASPGS